MHLAEQLLILFTVGLLCAIAMTPVMMRLAFRVGLLDMPDGTRKLHARPTPVIGGPIILFGTFMAIAVGWFLGGATGRVLPGHLAQHLGLLTAASLICALGVLDDFGKLRGRFKLLGQCVIVAIVILSGTKVDRITLYDGVTVELGFFGILFTAFWLLGAINSLNLLDGMDGLLSTIGLMTSLAFAGVAYLNQSWATACVAAGLAGTLLGFLRFNFPPAKIFLGDSGSMLIGLIIGVLGIQSSMKELATVSLAAPLALLILPIFDTLAAIVRRKLTGRSIYDVDRGHLHHRMSSSGFSNVSVLGMIAALCLITTCGALLASYLRNGTWALVSAALVVGILLVTKVFGGVELKLIQKRLANSASSIFNRQSSGYVRQMSIQLQGSANWDDLWNRLTGWAIEHQLLGISLDVNAPAWHEAYHGHWTQHKKDLLDKELWQFSLPLCIKSTVVGKMELRGSIRQPFADVLAQMSAMIQEVEQVLTTIDERAGTKITPAPQKSPRYPEYRLEKV
ncbi:MAG TPA: MraY family glycosyltransferase [Gemmatales bacterium]|nr:MraY family glycosyltransferase [Gemmatales bacterium]